MYPSPLVFNLQKKVAPFRKHSGAEPQPCSPQAVICGDFGSPWSEVQFRLQTAICSSLSLPACIAKLGCRSMLHGALHVDAALQSLLLAYDKYQPLACESERAVGIAVVRCVLRGHPDSRLLLNVGACRAADPGFSDYLCLGVHAVSHPSRTGESDAPGKSSHGCHHFAWLPSKH